MKNFIMASIIVLSGVAHAADSGMNAQYLKMKVYKLAVSKSVYCTNPQTIFVNETPGYEDILSSPTLGNGSILHGSYNCVMLEISDQIKFASESNSDSGGCVLGEENTLDICRQEQTTSIGGQVSNCQVGDDRVTLYLSTISTDENQQENGVEAFRPPTQGHHNYGLNLGNALNVAGPKTGTFVVNANGKVSDILDDGSRQCELDPPTFSFR